MVVVVLLLSTQAMPAASAALCREWLASLDQGRNFESSMTRWDDAGCAELMLRGSGSQALTIVSAGATSLQRLSRDATYACRDVLRQMDAAGETRLAKLEQAFVSMNCSTLLLHTAPIETRVLVA